MAAMRPSRLGGGRNNRLYNMESGYDALHPAEGYGGAPQFVATVEHRPEEQRPYNWAVEQYAAPASREGEQDVQGYEEGTVRTRERAVTAVEAMTKRMIKGRNLRTGR